MHSILERAVTELRQYSKGLAMIAPHQQLHVHCSSYLLDSRWHHSLHSTLVLQLQVSQLMREKDDVMREKYSVMMM